MAVAMRGRADLQIQKKWKDRETSPERTKVWTEPSKPKATERRVPVVYYLSRNGQLEHPHFMEVPLSSSEGLYLRDVINRLIFLRGKAMPSMYSWSSKRSYKNGFVWHDLAENDFIYPAHGHEYVLKGSELLDAPPNAISHETVSPNSQKPPASEMHKPGEDPDFRIVTRRRNQSWSSSDFNEYKVYKAESSGDLAGKAADAATQTDEKRRRRRAIRERAEKEEDEEREEEEVRSEEIQKKSEEEEAVYEHPSTELSREEISPPPSDSSPETLEALMKADGKLIRCSAGAVEEGQHETGRNLASGRMRASSVLMQLISCGSMSFRDCGAGAVKELPLMRMPRGGNQVGKEGEPLMGAPGIGGGARVEDKEYFSGSLIERKKDEFPALKRSSSYNADGCSRRLELAEEGVDGVRAKCIPRKSKPTPPSPTPACHLQQL
ncbi:protein SOSEKI 5 [Malania oleifera]|uniref:protein SOSEKI 5 n=1 Tax=Malania oleifera TaxID=397392 RepID=UPI0025AE3C88|nr:protein SOSEKI 5 [Malania oleifera]